ncbi:MAG: cytochrome c biogenesis protein [Cytophagaceae bacterium]
MNTSSDYKNSFFSWWKIITMLLLIYTVVQGLLGPVPRLPILNETIRNLYFHVPMWFGMTFVLLLSFIFSIMYLAGHKHSNDNFAVEAANTGIAFGVLGLITGMIWAKFTWGQYWSGDPKQNASAIGLLIYLAYMVLRGSFSDDQQRARISAIYNIFAFPILFALLYILPRQAKDSLHPGNGGNPAFSSYDLNFDMKLVFYPSVIAFILLAVWITILRTRMRNADDKLNGIES